MKIKKGKKTWFILSVIFTILMLIGTIGAIIVNKNFDSFNLIIIFLLISNISNFTENKK